VDIATTTRRDIARGGAEVLELVELLEQRRVLLEREEQLIVRARAKGVSWQLLGALLGVSRQAVQQRHRRLVARNGSSAAASS